jgi:hypothetical protein
VNSSNCRGSIIQMIFPSRSNFLLASNVLVQFLEVLCLFQSSRRSFLNVCTDLPTLEECDAGSSQQWRLNADGTIQSSSSGKCLNVEAARTAEVEMFTFSIAICNINADYYELLLNSASYRSSYYSVLLLLI